MEKKSFSKEELDRIIEEITQYSVELEEDPTRPDLGNKYINKVLALCRSYQNRVAYYLQMIRNQERDLKKHIKLLETDIEMKSSDMLATNNDVKKLPNISDRKALVSHKLSTEYQEISDQKLLLLDLQETSKIVKMQYDHLKQTTRDIQMQRSMVRDEREILNAGGEAMGKPSAINGIYKDGMPAAISPDRNMRPSIPLNEKELSELPKPIDDSHKEMMERFLSSSMEPKRTNHVEKETVEIEKEPKLEDILI